MLALGSSSYFLCLLFSYLSSSFDIHKDQKQRETTRHGSGFDLEKRGLGRL